MAYDDMNRDSDVNALVQSVHQELRGDFLRSLPARVSVIEMIAQSAVESPLDTQAVHLLRAETHRLAGTTAVYGLLKTSDVVRRFDHLLLERINAGILTLCPNLLQRFLADLAAAIESEAA